MIVKIEQQHIDRGLKGDPECCAVSQALRAMGLRKVRTGTKWITFNGWFFKTPKKLFQFIRDFDYGKEVKPIECELK